MIKMVGEGVIKPNRLGFYPRENWGKHVFGVCDEHGTIRHYYQDGDVFGGRGYTDQGNAIFIAKRLQEKNPGLADCYVIRISPRGTQLVWP